MTTAKGTRAEKAGAEGQIKMITVSAIFIKSRR
jgi:hypothetical protein